MPIIITPIYAGLLTLIYIFLSGRVIVLRRKFWISIGDKGNTQLLRQQRVHGNFNEYVPLALILMMGAELMLTASWIIHALGIALVAGRAMHAYGIGKEPESLTMRSYGMILTFLALLVGSLVNIAQAFLMADFAG